ncbi:MAG: cytochrome P450 [Pseudomonadota bacterium]
MGGKSQQAESFDINSIDSGFIDNPYPTLELLRENDPVHWNPDGSLFLTRYRDIQKVYQDRSMISDKREIFSKKFGDSALYNHHTTSLVFNDPPYHTTVRKLLTGAFTPRKLAEMEPLIEEIVDKLLDELEDKREFDFVSEFAMRLPTEIISFMLGVPEAYREKLRGYSLSILGALDAVVSQEQLENGNQAVVEFGQLLDELIEHRRKNPDEARQGEVLQSLIFGEYEGNRLNQNELIQNCIFLLNAGHETTTSLMANGVGILLLEPEQFRVLVEKPEFIDSAVEEILRYESPLQIGNRLTPDDMEFSGVRVPAGTYIHTSIASANRDPEIFGKPEEFNVTRRNNRHLAFITGIHVCLGATLARYEGRIAFGKLISRFPNLSANGPAERLPLARFRGFVRLPVSI